MVNLKICSHKSLFSQLLFLYPWRNFGWHIKIAPSLCLSLSVCCKSCVSHNWKIDEENLIKLHRKIKQNETVYHAPRSRSQSKVKGLSLTNRVSTITQKQLKYGWMDDMRFYVLFNSVSVISGRWEVDNDWLCAMELCLRLRRFCLGGDRTGSTRSVGQRLTHWATGAPTAEVHLINFNTMI